MWMRSTHDASPHSQMKSSGSEARSNVSASVSMRSLTSRKTASFRPMRASRPSIGIFLDDHVSIVTGHDLCSRFLGLLMADSGDEVSRMVPDLCVLRTCQLDNLHAVLDRTLAEKRDPLHPGADRIRPAADALVRLPKSLVVRSDPFDVRIG